MIPLMFVNKPDSMLEESTISIKDMKPIYRQASKTLEVEFKYNLDEFFQIRIILNEFDQPKYVYLKTNKVGEYIEVKPEQQEYVLDGNFVVSILTYDDILNIANNAIKADRIKEWDIKSKIFSGKKDPNVLMTTIQFEEYIEQLTFTLNEKVYDYYVQDFMPVLEVDNTVIKPTYIYNYYYVYDIKIGDEDYQIAIIHPKGFKEHYIFRQTDATHFLSLNKGTLADKHHNRFYFMNGSIIENDRRESLQLFMNNIYGQEYKQYILNIIRDRNLYTEIANAFNIAKHHSLMVYDYRTDQRIAAKVEASFEYNKFQIAELVLRAVNPKDQFGEDYEHSIEFHIPNVNTIKLADLNTPYRLSDVAYFVIDGKYLPIANEMMEYELDGYITASNVNLFLSVNKGFIEYCIKDAMQNLLPSIKLLDDGIIMNPLKKLKAIDYQNQVVTLQNVTQFEDIPFSELPNNDFIASADMQVLSPEGVQSLFGMKFKVPPLKVETSPVTPDQFDFYLLLIKHTEVVGYSYDRLEEDTYYFAASIKVTFEGREFAFVYNVAKDKIYYIDLTNQDSSQDMEGVESMSMYFEDVNEHTLGSFLHYNSLMNLLVKDGGYGIQVDFNRNLYPYMVYRTISGKPLFSGKDGVSDTIDMSYGFRTRNNNLLALYNQNNKVMQEKFRGIFTTSNTKLDNVSVDDNGLSISYTCNNVSKTLLLTLEDGKFVFFDIMGNKKEIDYKSVSGFNDRYGVINAIYDENTQCGVAVDVNIVSEYINNKDLKINNEMFINDDNNCYFVETEEAVTSQDISVDVEFSDTTHAVIEDWFGKELYGITEITDEFNNDNFGDVLEIIDVYKSDKYTIYKLPKVIAKNISVY